MRTHEPDPELEALLDDVRAERPAIDPAFAARLGERVAAGFSEEESAWRRGARRWRAWPAVGAVAAAALAAAVVLPTVLGGGGEERAAVDSPQGAPPGSAQGAPAVQRREEGAADGAASLPVPEAPGRAVERITGLTLAVPDAEVQGTANQAIAVADRVDGFVETSTVDVGPERASATLTLRVPTDRVNDALAALSRLADVRERTQRTTDLTDSLESTQERLDDARATRDGLRSALREAQSAKEVTDLRERLEDARDRVRRLGGERARLRERTNLATVDVTVEGTGGPPPGDQDGGVWTPGDALGDAVDVLRVAAGVAIVALAAAVPATILAALVALALAALRRRARERALDAA